MAEKAENPARENVLASDVKCRAPLSGLTSAPRAPDENPASNRGGKAEVGGGGDIEQLEKKRTRRRRKAKRKNPYNKNNPEVRGKKPLRLVRGKNGYEQPVAPYNSNQFLIEDHNDLQDFDSKLLAVAQAKTEGLAVDGVPRRTGRVRDPSFTSADSDDDYFYSSPEDEEEFLTKEFSNTYQDLHAEDLASMSKSELIQQVLQLEEKCDALEKRLSEEKKLETTRSDSESTGSCGVEDKMLVYQKEISKLTHVNEELKNENMKLKQQHNCGSGGGKCGTESSEDSESDSSSSSDSSEMSEGEEGPSGQPSPPHNPYKHMNGRLDHMETDNVT